MTGPTLRHVLLIEDNPADARLIAEYLAEKSWPNIDADATTVDNVNRLAGARDTLSEEVDVVLLDLGLPDSSGVETLDEVLSIGVPAPVVVMSHVAAPATRELAQDIDGMDAIVGDHAAMDATFFDRETASKHYCRRTNYRVQTLKATALVDTKTQAVLDVHCTTEKRHDTQIGWQLALRNAGEIVSLAADKGYDWQRLREKLREEDVRPLIKHREFRPVDCAHNARIDGSLYGQRALSETVFSTIKRTLGHAVRARAWYREFREIVLMCAVYNIKRAVKP